MGNWRTVHIVGTCSPEDLPRLREYTDSGPGFKRFHCLSRGFSLCGLGEWPAEQMDVVGNLSERDYSVEQVRETLSHLAFACPSLSLVCHCGGDYEDPVCVATIWVGNERAVVEKPHVERLPDLMETANRRIDHLARFGLPPKSKHRG